MFVNIFKNIAKDLYTILYFTLETILLENYIEIVKDKEFYD